MNEFSIDPAHYAHLNHIADMLGVDKLLSFGEKLKEADAVLRQNLTYLCMVDPYTLSADGSTLSQAVEMVTKTKPIHSSNDMLMLIDLIRKHLGLPEDTEPVAVIMKLWNSVIAYETISIMLGGGSP